MSTYVLDGANWVLYNPKDEECAEGRRVREADLEVQMSEGTAGFISSMEAADNDSDAGTTYELASADDVKELQR